MIEEHVVQIPPSPKSSLEGCFTYLGEESKRKHSAPVPF